MIASFWYVTGYWRGIGDGFLEFDPYYFGVNELGGTIDAYPVGVGGLESLCYGSDIVRDEWTRGTACRIDSVCTDTIEHQRMKSIWRLSQPPYENAGSEAGGNLI